MINENTQGRRSAVCTQLPLAGVQGSISRRTAPNTQLRPKPCFKPSALSCASTHASASGLLSRVSADDCSGEGDDDDDWVVAHQAKRAGSFTCSSATGLSIVPSAYTCVCAIEGGNGARKAKRGGVKLAKIPMKNEGIGHSPRMNH